MPSRFSLLPCSPSAGRVSDRENPQGPRSTVPPEPASGLTLGVPLANRPQGDAGATGATADVFLGDQRLADTRPNSEQSNERSREPHPPWPRNGASEDRKKKLGAQLL